MSHIKKCVTFRLFTNTMRLFTKVLRKINHTFYLIFIAFLCFSKHLKLIIMKIKIKAITAILLIAITITNCKKGDTGPAGKDGVNGNANVVSSSVTSSNWAFVSPAWEMTLTYPAITQNILDKGAVLVYVQSGSNYYQLPYTFYPANTYSRSYTFVHYIGGLKVFVTDSDLTQPTNPGSLTFKVVVIAASQRLANPNINWKNYTEVKEALNLKD
jgi:hypothetical protein